MTTTHDSIARDLPLKIAVRIRDFPCKGALVQRMVCNGIARRLRSEYPSSEVTVEPSISVPKGFKITLSSEVNFDHGILEFDIRRLVQNSLDLVEADYARSCTNQLRLTSTDSAIRIYQLETENKMLEVALRELASATEYILLSSQGFDREVAQKAVAEAEGLLGDRKPRYVGGGALTLAEMVRALRNIHYDLTCDRCAVVFYTGEPYGEHSPDCHTVRADGSAEKED
jgi:hypothetical protein